MEATKICTRFVNGFIVMKYAVFSDIHGNLPALELMLKDVGRVDGYICLGDTVDYGPWSNECVDLVSSLPNAILLQGNHEQDFITGSYSGSNATAQQFFDFCYPSFNRFNKINNLASAHKLNGFTFQHTINQQNVYPDTILTLDRNYVIGHSHHQFKIENNGFTLYNSGSVGQNRKYINVINYLLLDSGSMNFELRAVTYDVEPLIQAIRDKGYPQACIDYYDQKERS